VETFSFAPWMTARAKRLRLYRFLANSFWYWMVIGLIAGLLRWALPQLSDLVGYVAVPFAVFFGVLAIPWLLVSWGFQFGLIKCPACDRRFAPRFPPWIPKSCQNCHYDIYTLRHRGDF
jgi:hypothetical protein